MNKNDVIAALTERLGAPTETIGRDVHWGAKEEGTSFAVCDNIDGPERVEVVVYGAPGTSMNFASLAVAETITDFAWLVARREVSGLGTVAPLAVVVEAVFAMMGMSRYSYDEVLAAFVGDFGPRSAIRSHSFRGDSSEWVRDDRVLRITPADVGVTVAMHEDGETREHLIVETTATPYAAERVTYDEAMRKSGSCSLANALDAARVFLASGHYHGRRR